MALPLSIGGERLRRSFKKTGFVLDVPSVEVPAGSTMALLGPSGSGKTTLLHLLALLERPDAGRVLLDGRAVTTRDRDARLSLAAVFQRPYLFKGSVRQNVEYGLMVRGIPAEERAGRVADALERVGLSGYADRSALSLSGGESQRVSLARALVVEPRVLLLDEPLASLDALLKRRLTQDFASILRDSGVTVVYVTHDQDEALTVADYIAVMREGRIVASGSADEVTSLPSDDWTAGFLGLEAPATAVVKAVHEGLVELASAASVIFASGSAEVGSAVTFAVRPEDVLLFEAGAELPLTTARNRLEAVIDQLEPRGATVLARLRGDGVRLAASVSRAAASELSLQPGMPVLAVFKATAVRWRPQEDDRHG